MKENGPAPLGEEQGRKQFLDGDNQGVASTQKGIYSDDYFKEFGAQHKSFCGQSATEIVSCRCQGEDQSAATEWIERLEGARHILS